ncbi:MAG: M23 family metallopeptidase [Eubacteriales bacterium]|nr:M23 family metallopeptidase [Eubacteriales bacterium]MDD3289768.1 M23 family metallopeptidase [Eubacteriales bacterium]MDD3864037.1 M23 family metallopeptidase [Eubacteriales bacterium]MDD4445141.1 M23 family metallopeptidase [Eubacteriales bacterium]
MKFPKRELQLVGSVKARCQKSCNPSILTAIFIVSLALLFTSLMWTPAEAGYRTEGFAIVSDGLRVVSTMTEQDALDILEGVQERYQLEGAEILDIGFRGRVTVEACDIILQEAKNVEAGLAYILQRNTPLLTVLSRQKYIQTREVEVGPAYTEEVPAIDVFDKIKAERYTGLREYSIILTMENDRVVSRDISDIKLILTAEEHTGSKGLTFTEEGQIRFALSFIPPVALNVTSAYGESRSETGYHLGVDLYNPGGTPIVAAASGVVVQVSSGGSYGNLIIIDHGGGVQTYYSHCRSMDVTLGQTVDAGDYIGTVGNTGRTTGNHLHFELRLNGATLDPMDYL